MVESAPVGGAEHFGTAWGQLNLFADMIVREGEVRGLVGPRELDRLWTRHILNSAAVLDFIPTEGTIIDVGSGAGFPGLVVAICRQDCRVNLVDSMERRCDWLRDAVDELSLNNVVVTNARSESLVGKVSADVVTARAVARVNKLLGWTMPLLKPGGSLIALKGVSVDSEIDDAVPQLKKFKAAYADVHAVTPFGTVESTNVLEIRKKG
ncbi:MAG: 16S rRNA (guanine(527)-N(7))-methyltransferase RsmG [Ancrocorticia sp.]|uniref:16S rRNA (guanine(527)-N(7))-methyltransferase RsmG n=2 Tax=Ancrocorticia sp. TaxID=2593684 RepID=UPI003F918D7B